jgi:hypothetical protein
VGRSRRHLRRASIRPRLNRSAAPCTAQTGEWAHAHQTEAERLAQRQALGYCRGLKL